ncbi:MAG: DUF3276 family protein [Ferruginibacter sp.]|nr:DUF3276 family protein [Ferruginibacter sp.]
MAYENNENNEQGERRQESVYSKRIKAGKRRTYFFDIRETRSSDYYLTITESRKKMDAEGYDRHKIFVYKEDFNKFANGLIDAIEYVKTDLMPDFDFDAFNHDTPYEGDGSNAHTATIVENKTEETVAATPVVEPTVTDAPVADNGSTIEVDKW